MSRAIKDQRTSSILPDASDTFPAFPSYSVSEARICSEEPQQLAPRDDTDADGTNRRCQKVSVQNDSSQREGRQRSGSRPRIEQDPIPARKMTSESLTHPSIDTPAEGSHATTPRRISTPSVVRKRGRPKKRGRGGPNGMGRNPLRTQISRYLEANAGYLAEPTLIERRRKLEAFQRRYADICRHDQTLRRDPAKWSEVEVRAILLEMRQHDWNPTTQAHELENIAAVLRFVGNPVLDTMRARIPTLFPRRLSHRGPSLSAEERQRVLSAAEGIGGWNGEIARILIATHLYTGLRPKELRVSEVTDIDILHWVLHVRHPKGEGTYGDPRDMAIPEPLRPFIVQYLRARERLLTEKGKLTARPLLCRKDNPDAFYSANRLQTIKAKVEQLSGVKFELRALRRTYGQMLLDNDADLEVASLALGHRSVRTTQAYYCQKSMDIVRSEVLRALGNETSTPPGTENRLISPTDDYTGYG